MRLRPRSYGWRFFYVSTLVVILAGGLSVVLFLFFAFTNVLGPSGKSISATQMDGGLHDLAPALGELWLDPTAWREEADRFRQEHRLGPVRLMILDAEGRVLFREDAAESPLTQLFGRETDRLTKAQLVQLLAGKIHLQNDMIYAVAPITSLGEPVGVLLGYLHPYSAYQSRPRTVPQLLILIIPGLATIIVSSLASLYLARGMRRRLGGLTGAIQAMAEGDYRNRLSDTAEDEIGRVARAFNDMADRLAEARAQEYALERLKRELITNVSHDLRGPLTSMEGYLEALKDGLAGDEATRRKYLTTISQKTEQLARLVEDLLLYARLESGNLPLDQQDESIADWLRESLAKVEPDLALAGLELSAEIPESDVRVKLDARRMDQVVANLAQNAVRYAPPGTSFAVALTFSEDSAAISFRNHGPNLAPADLPHIFERFYRGQNTADGVGAGLGLAVAAQIVRAHGGEIRAENLPGEGVRFVITMPL